MAQQFTELFRLGRIGDRQALSLAYSLVFSNLHRVAAGLLHRERRGGSVTLQPTALVSEVFLRLFRLEAQVLNREHFVALAARSMKQHLIDRSRHRAVRERCAPELAAAFCGLAHPANEDQLAARQVWERLRSHDPLAADVVWSLKVDGLTINETSARTKIAAWRVVALNETGLTWMARKLQRRG